MRAQSSNQDQLYAYNSSNNKNASPSQLRSNNFDQNFQSSTASNINSSNLKSSQSYNKLQISPSNINGKSGQRPQENDNDFQNTQNVTLFQSQSSRSQNQQNQFSSSQTREDQKFNNDDEEQEEDDDDDDDQPRWDEDALKDMDFLCTFLDNEEDNLPDIFDTKKIKKQKTENCGLCEKNLGRSALAGAITGTGSFHKRHHCRKCGTTVCSLCSQQKRRLSKVDKKKYRVCDVCDTLMSNCNFESMYDNCLKQQASTLSELKKNITKKELQIKQVNLHTDKYRKQLESKLKEISEKEQQKRSLLADKQDILEMHQKEYEEQKAKLDQMTVEIDTKNKLIEELQEQRAKLKAEKKKVETQRIRKENELKDQNKKLHEVIEVDYAQSFEQNHYEQVDGILERDQYRDDDTDYEESYSVKEKLTLLDQAVGRYTTNTHDNHNGGGTRQFDHYDNESDNEDDRIRDDTVATTRYQVIGNKMQ